VALADIRLRDNHYEYRERLMEGWVRDVVAAIPAPPDGNLIRIIDLPRLAIDPGIHLEAALQLAYGEGDLRLEVVQEETAVPGKEPVLRWTPDGIVPARSDEWRFSPGEVPGDDGADVEEIDAEKRNPGGDGTGREEPPRELP